MNSHKINTADSPALRLVDSRFSIDSLQEPTHPGSHAESQLLAKLRDNGALDPDTRALIEEGLDREADTVRLWFLLAALECAPMRAVATDLIFRALCRLSEADSPILRLSAYRWLAGLHKVDLRYANRAKLKLGDCLASECGLIQQRLNRLLSDC